MVAIFTTALVASATPAFDPSTPAVRLEGPETWTTVDGEDVRLWSAIERWVDPDVELFTQEAFNDATRWRDADYSPFIATAFGTDTPPSSTFLLHHGLSESAATGTPVLYVCGAGDNASRGFITMATHLDRLFRPVYALTFAHPHGDVFQQAEVVADALAVIRERTGAAQVDVVAHSKGGIAATIYASHHAGADWGNPTYEQRGTPYAGDVRNLVLVATPLGGIDTAFRWSSTNVYGLVADEALAPTAWDRYYPSGTLVPLVHDELVDQDFLPDGRDLFPGQRQLLARQDHPLPGSQAWLGAWALQTDWYTTYEGGLGLVSRSDGIDRAIGAGGDVISRLERVGVDPDVAVTLLAGTNPLMPNGDEELVAQFARLGRLTDYGEMLQKVTDHGFPVAADSDELGGLEDGWLVLGEVTGPSDGLVFVTSATHEAAITARGAVVREVRTANLSHLDLLYASPITGDLLEQAADQGGPDEQWMRGVGRRYTEEDTIGWLDGVLADPPPPDETGETGETGHTGIDGPTPTPPPGEFDRPCGSCSHPGVAPVGAPLLLLAAALRRRR
jgi:pimeloyl-ACP methyl ester carboxylesterase